MAYREDLSCQECLKRKEKSPKMPMNARDIKFLRFLIFAFAMCLGVAITIVGSGTLLDHNYASWGIAVAVSGGCFWFAALVIGLGYFGAFE